MFDVKQAVNTPMGKAYILEVSGGVAYVELTNRVEMDFPVDGVQDWDEFEAEKDAKFKAEREQADQANQPTLEQRLRLGELVLNHIFRDDPKGRKAFTKMAADVVISRAHRVIAEYEKR